MSYLFYRVICKDIKSSSDCKSRDDCAWVKKSGNTRAYCRRKPGALSLGNMPPLEGKSRETGQEQKHQQVSTLRGKRKRQFNILRPSKKPKVSRRESTNSTEEKNICPICLEEEFYEDESGNWGKLIPCPNTDVEQCRKLHRYHERCLKTLKNSQNLRIIKCPECRRKCIVRQDLPLPAPNSFLLAPSVRRSNSFDLRLRRNSPNTIRRSLSG